MLEKIKLLINRMGKKMIKITNSVIDVSDKRYIEYKISAWKYSKERMSQIKGDTYYRGCQDILKRKRQAIGTDGELVDVDNLPNNLIVDNQYAKMVDQKKNYLLGQPIVVKTENEKYNDILNDVFDKSFMKNLNDLGRNSITGGISWLHPYYDDNGEFKFKIFPAYEILPFWDDKAHTKLKFACRYYIEEKPNSISNEYLEKVEVYTPYGIFYYELINNTLFPDSKTPRRDYFTIESDDIEQGYNWIKIPLIPFKFNSLEIPLINRCKNIQDAINTIISDYVNGMEENAGGSSILVLENYDGENLGEFREKLSKLRAIKVRSTDAARGDVRTLQIEVNSANYESILKELKNQLVENCRGFDAKDDRMSNNPNQMNIKSMYTDIDLDAHDMQAEYELSLDELLWFIDQHIANMGLGSYEKEKVDFIFNKDTVVNETEVMTMLTSAGVRIPNEILLEQVPFIDDLERAKKLLEEEEQKQLEIYGNGFDNGGKLNEE